MGSKVEPVEPRNYYDETRETLQAQYDLAGDKFDAEREFRPQYAQLDMDIAKTMTPQMLELFKSASSELDTIAETSNRSQREADLTDVEDLGTRAMEAFRAANPEQAALMAEMNTQALAGLQSGGMDAGLLRESQQAIRAGQSARGFGMGPSDVFNEARFTASEYDRYRNQSRGFADRVVGLNQATSADPFLAILGRSGRNPLEGGSVFGQANSLNPGNLFNPESGYASDVYNTNFNAASAANIANANNKAALSGAAIGAFGSIAGGAFGMGG